MLLSHCMTLIWSPINAIDNNEINKGVEEPLFPWDNNEINKGGSGCSDRGNRKICEGTLGSRYHIEYSEK